MTRPLLQEPAPPRARDVAAGEALDASDAELVARSLHDPVAFAAVFDRHWAAIHAFCTSRAGDAGEDLAAEAFRIAFDRRAAYDVRYPGARPWLYGVATNVLREHFRGAERADRAARRTYALADRTVAEPLGALEAAQLGPRLAVALASLDAADRDTLLLAAWAELTYDEIAHATGVPVGTVRSRLHRARTRLRTHLESSQGDAS
jgi:RNA polymerase sigma-70 factor (ECF subfamily)